MEIAAVLFVVVMLGVAYVVFRLMKRTVKMMVRAVIVLVIIAIALFGGTALWNLNTPGSKNVKSSRTK
ncbi:MAG: hypothetical protein ACK5NT_06345 [Pyrinomonadaceae bacterium]